MLCLEVKGSKNTLLVCTLEQALTSLLIISFFFLAVCVCVPRAWRLAGRGTGQMLSSCGVVLRNWEWMSLSKMRYAEILKYSILEYTDYEL